MQKKYSSDKETIRLTESDLNSPVSIAAWIEDNFEGIKIKNIDPKNLIFAIEGILHDENFISLSNEKKKHFIDLFNKLKEKLKGIKELT